MQSSQMATSHSVAILLWLALAASPVESRPLVDEWRKMAAEVGDEYVCIGLFIGRHSCF